jgi:PAS domain S-box-containing protein
MHLKQLLNKHRVHWQVLRRAETTLQGTESMYRELLEGQGEGFAMLDAQERFLLVNRSAEKIFGAAPGSLAGRSLLEFLAADEAERLRGQTALHAQGEASTCELRIRREDGAARTILVTAIPRAGKAGPHLQVIRVFRDITEQKQAEQDLRDALLFNEQIITGAKEGIIVYGPDLRYRVWNPFMEELSGIPASAVLGRHPLELFPFLAESGVLARLEQALAGQAGDAIEFPFQVPGSGKSGWNIDSTSPLRNAKGEVIGVIGLVTDITSRKQAEASLLETQAILQAAMDQSPAGIAIADAPAGSLRYVNEAGLAIRGGDWKTIADGVGSNQEASSWQLLDLDRQPLAASEAPLARAVLHGEASQRKFIIKRTDQAERIVSARAAPVRDGSGAVIAGVVVFSDITEREAAEQAILVANQKLDLHLQQTPVAVIEWDPAFRVLRWNPAAERIFGYSAAEALGRPVSFIVPEADHPAIEPGMRALLEGRGSERITYVNVHKDGRSLHCKWYNTVLRDGQGQVLGIASLVDDISERIQGEEALRISKDLLAKALSVSPDGYAITRLEDGVYFGINEGFTRITGYAEADVLGRSSVSDLAPLWADRRDRERLVAGLKETGEVLDLEATFLGKGGMPFLGLISAKAFELDGKSMLLSITRDITQLRKAEAEKLNLLAQLQQSQKMESLGTLASGVAHDMNNVLGAILGLASAHIDNQPSGSPLHRAFDTICKATERGGKMVKSLLSFSRRSPGENKVLEVNALLRDQAGLLERTTLAKVQLEMDLEASLQPIQGDANGLAHAFMNLCVNAVDAMPEGGTLSLRSRNIDEDWIEVVVQDNGTGMVKEVLEKALDPFFTTKETGKGTGLGLSMVYSTVTAHRGQLAIQSEPGAGTCVRMRFPAYVGGTEIAEPEAAAAAQTQQRSLKVLLVDDDELIQSSMQVILEVMGHTITPVPSGEEALASLATGFEPDLVILDMNMPGLGGAGTLPRLRRLRPTVPVLLATGRTDQTALALVAAHPGVTLLAKPFGLRELQKHLESLGLT